MSYRTEEPTMTAEEWFAGGQMESLQRMGMIRDPEKRKEALQQFNDLNNAFLEEKAAHIGAPEKAKTHPAIDAAIDEAINREKGWIKDVGGMSNEQLRDRYIDRALKQDIARNRVDPHSTLSEYKVSRPDLVEFAEKFTRGELERKEFLSRMIHDRGFNVSKAKIAHERKLNPELVAIAEKNIGHRRLPGLKYNDALFAEVSQVKKTMNHAKAVGFKI